jgi:arylsulfatase A-like enzyme
MARRRAVVVIADGLRRDLFAAAAMPRMAAWAAERATRFAAHRPVFPSATRVSSASFATGCWPRRHGLQGNTVALPGPPDGAPQRHDVGDPAFFGRWRAATGGTLRVPTLAERLRDHGGAMVYANASPGAALAHDPDGHGEVRHRAVAQGPGRAALDPLPVGPDPAGDAAMTTLFLARALVPEGPALSVLWLGGPDWTQHLHPLGSPEARAALAAADSCAARVVEAVDDRLRAAGEEVLLLFGSDHGHETVAEVVDVEAALVAAGLKDRLDSRDVVVASNGTAALIYLDPAVAAARRGPLGAFLRAQPWTGAVFGEEALAEVGQAPEHGLAFAVAMRAEAEAVNAHGVPGLARAARPAEGKPDRLGCGQHGGLGAHETAPVLVAEGPGFATGAVREAPSAIIDIAPTVLRHLGLDPACCDGRPLQT